MAPASKAITEPFATSALGHHLAKERPYRVDGSARLRNVSEYLKVVKPVCENFDPTINTRSAGTLLQLG